MNGPANPATDALLSIVEDATVAAPVPSPNGAGALG
jgi:hypothetical protein